MRIAEISVHGCPLRPLGSNDAGGMNLHVRQLSRELGKLGVEVDVFTRWHDSGEPEMMIGEKARLIHIAAGNREDMSKTDIYQHLPHFLDNLRRFLEREKTPYDVLHSHYWLSASVAERLKEQLRIPHVVTFHTLGEIKNRARPAEMEPEWRLEAERKAIALTDRIIVFTAEERANLERIYGVDPDKVKVIPGGVDLELFHPMSDEEARRELGFSSQAKVLLFAGRQLPLKGIDILLGAMARLNGIGHLILVGGDSATVGETVRLRSLATKLGIGDKVTFTGMVDHGRMPLFYNAADVCVVPSYYESFGLVVAEALACGTPVVASRVGGLTTLVNDGETGYLVDELSAAAFASCLERLLGDDELRRRMGDTARSSVMKYAWSKVARQVLQVYEELTAA